MLKERFIELSKQAKKQRKDENGWFTAKLGDPK
jgi:hypothetical protein